jgi:hypothetical protein
MKRISAVILFVALACTFGLAQTIDEIQQQLTEHIAARVPLAARGNVLDKKADQISFVYDAFVKQSAVQTQELAAYDAKNADVAHRMAVIQPSLDNWTQRLNYHNANKCTEHCTQGGGCDGSCAGYERERVQLEQNQAALKEAMAPITALANEVDAQHDHLVITSGQLAEIQAGLQKDVPAYKAAEAALKADWDANEAAIARLQAQLAKYKGENDACFAKIPPACQVNPLLDDQCEKMHAACGKMFDGNR